MPFGVGSFGASPFGGPESVTSTYFVNLSASEAQLSSVARGYFRTTRAAQSQTGSLAASRLALVGVEAYIRFTTVTYLGIVLVDSPLSAWMLNEASGATTFLDSAFVPNDITIGSPFGITYGIDAGFGDREPGIAVNGTQVRATIPSLTIGTTCTFEFWITPTALGPTPYSLILGQAAGGDGVYYDPAVRKILVRAGADDRNTTAMTVGSLYHVMISIAAGSGTFYINGVANGTFVGWAGITLDSFLNTAGGGAALVATFLGRPAVYPYALTAGQAAAHYAAYSQTLPRLTTGSLTFTGTPSFGISTTANLNITSALSAAAEFDIATSATLSGATSMTAAAGIQFSVAAQTSAPAPLAAAAAVGFTVATPNLTAESLLSAASTILVSSSNPTLIEQADLSAASTFGFSASGTIIVTGPTATTAVVAFNGVTQSPSHVLYNTVAIEDVLNEAPNTCEFTVDGSPPAVGTGVKIGLLNFSPDNLLFAGTVVRNEQLYEGSKQILRWAVFCQDYTFLLNRHVVFGNYKNVSASTVATTIVNQFTSGFSAAAIVNGLPNITISFDGRPVMDALTQIANLIGGYAYVDYSRQVHLYVTETPASTPDALDGTGTKLKQLPAVKYTVDEQQVRNRASVKGAGTAIAGDSGFFIQTGSSIIPMENVDSFSSGQVVSEDWQFISYTGTNAGGTTTTVANGQAPGNVPTSGGNPSLISGVTGGLSGNYRWAVAFANSTGESIIGQFSTPLFFAPDVVAPSSVVGLGATGVVGPLVGALNYKTSFITSLGETLPGPATGRTAAALTQPLTVNVSTAFGAGGITPGGNYSYKVTYVTKFGETSYLDTPPSSYLPAALSLAGLSFNAALAFGGLFGQGTYQWGVSNVTASGESPLAVLVSNGFFSTVSPNVAPVWSGQQTPNGGRIEPGFTYLYALSYYSDTYGETDLGISSSLNVGGAVTVAVLMNMPVINPAIGDGVRVWRAKTNGTFRLLADFRYPLPSSFTDALSQGEMNTAPPKQFRAGQAERLNVFASAEGGVLARRIYRTKLNGSDFFLIGEVQNNFNVTIDDFFFDNQLNQRNPAVNTTGRQATISLPIGPSGVIGRRVYRTKNGGATYFLVADVKDNVTGTWTDALPDSALSSAAQGVNTAGGETHLVTSIPIGPPGTLARRIYRTRAGGTEYKLVGQLSDNSVTSFTDDVPDDSLSGGVQLVSSAGASAVLLSGVQTGPVGTTERIIYRTDGTGDFTTLKYAGTINNNTATTFTDLLADKDLGRPPQTIVATIGVLPGDSTITLASVVGVPTAGWVEIDSQFISYTGISGVTLTGIPPLRSASITRVGAVATVTTNGAHGYVTNQHVRTIGANQTEYNGTHVVTVTGASTFTYVVSGTPATPATGTPFVSVEGAVIGSIGGGAAVRVVPLLTGVTGITSPIQIGSTLSLWIQVNDTAAQTSLAAAEGGDGVHEALIVDSALATVAACTARGNAELALFGPPRVTLNYVTTDKKTRSGRMIHVELPAPQSLNAYLIIQRVSLKDITVAPGIFPHYEVTASSSKFSVEDLFRHLVLNI